MRASSPKLPPSLMLVTHSPFTYTCRGRGTVSGPGGPPPLWGPLGGPPPSVHTHLQGMGRGAGVTLPLAAWGSPPQHPPGGRRSLHPHTPRKRWDADMLCPAQDQPRCPPHAQPCPRQGWTGTKVETLSRQCRHWPGPSGCTAQDPHLPGQVTLCSSSARNGRLPGPRVGATPPGIILPGRACPTQVAPSNPAALITSCPPVHPRLQQQPGPCSPPPAGPEAQEEPGLRSPWDPPTPRAAPKRPRLRSGGVEASAQGWAQRRTRFPFRQRGRRPCTVW